MANEAPIIIRKKKAAAHGHHGGAWKVAYADFVTAMMALFIVLWLMSSGEKVKKAVAGYFRDPAGRSDLVGNDLAGVGQGLEAQEKDMEKLKEKIEAAFRKIPEFQTELKDKVELIVTGEGLRIEFLENDRGLFFESGSSAPTLYGRKLLRTVAEQVSKLPNGLMIEGHTDSHPFAGAEGYSNWELSADRANAARRLMRTAGVRHDQTSQVRGFADQRLRKPKSPSDSSNRRISVVVQYLEVSVPEVKSKVEKAPSHG